MTKLDPAIPHSPVVVRQLEKRAADIQLRVADRITAFAGSMNFVYIHAVVFALWMLVFEKSPWPTLTLAVSLEAIFLSVFVLLSQNRQATKDRVHADIEYDVNLKAELEIAHLHEKIDRLTGDVLVRLDRVHRQLPQSADLDIASAEVRTLRSPPIESTTAAP